MRLFLAIWSLLWTLCLPLIWVYLRRRGRKDPDYTSHMAERFGRYSNPLPGAIWFHAVSLGEVRSAVPLIQAVLERGKPVVITCFTPAGRREAARVMAAPIAAGQVRVVWVPLELNWCFKGFFRAFRPEFGLVMEIEIWPRMVQAARDAGVPLLMCNAQYPQDSMARDAKMPLRPAVMRRFWGALVKSDLQRDRFAAVGVPNIQVTGELRFDQPIPPSHIPAGLAARAALAQGRGVVTLASVTEPEEGLILNAIKELRSIQTPAPLVVYVPRAPERFGPVGDGLERAGLSVLRRSRGLTPDLGVIEPAQPDVLLGDSLGEMYFYLAMADRVLVGAGFTPKGSHNIIEPLALGKPVLTGPWIQTIEYPAVEAIAAGVCLQVQPDGIAQALTPEGWQGPDQDQIQAFLAEHSGATKRTMAALEPLFRRP